MQTEISHNFNITYPANTPSWIQMIHEIHYVLHFSYSRIAYRIGCSPSSIQKLIKDFQRIPRDKMFFSLACYYHKLFYSDTSLPQAKTYVEANHDKTLSNALIDLLNRDFLDNEKTRPCDQENKRKLLQIAQQKGLLKNIFDASTLREF